MNNIKKLKLQISILYVCAVSQAALTLLSTLIIPHFMHPRILWGTSLALSVVALIFARPFQIMDALIDGYAAQKVIEQLANKKRKVNDEIYNTARP